MSEMGTIVLAEGTQYDRIKARAREDARKARERKKAAEKEAKQNATD